MALEKKIMRYSIKIVIFLFPFVTLFLMNVSAKESYEPKNIISEKYSKIDTKSTLLESIDKKVKFEHEPPLTYPFINKMPFSVKVDEQINDTTNVAKDDNDSEEKIEESNFLRISDCIISVASLFSGIIVFYVILFLFGLLIYGIFAFYWVVLRKLWKKMM